MSFQEIKKGKDRKIDWKKLRQSVGAGLGVLATLGTFAAIGEQLVKQNEKIDNLRFRATVTDARARAIEEVTLANAWAICTEGQKIGYFPEADCDQFAEEVQMVIINRTNELMR